MYKYIECLNGYTFNNAINATLWRHIRHIEIWRHQLTHPSRLCFSCHCADRPWTRSWPWFPTSVWGHWLLALWWRALTEACGFLLPTINHLFNNERSWGNLRTYTGTSKGHDVNRGLISALGHWILALWWRALIEGCGSHSNYQGH